MEKTVEVERAKTSFLNEVFKDVKDAYKRFLILKDYKMPVCGGCLLIPKNNINYTIVFTKEKDFCCKCKEWKQCVERVLIRN